MRPDELFEQALPPLSVPLVTNFRQKVFRRFALYTRQSVIGAQSLIDCGDAPQTALPYVGPVGLSNLGDEVLLELARRSFPTRKLVPVRLNPRVFRLALGRCIDRRRGILVGGGTVILSPGLLSALEYRAEEGLPFVCFGTGVHDPAHTGKISDSVHGRWLAAFARCRALGVRGPLSKSALDKMGFVGARVVGDPALLHLSTSFPPPVTEKVIGINIGTAWGGVLGKDEQTPVKRLADALRVMAQDGWRMRFFCVWPEDMQVLFRVIRLAGLAEKAEIIQEYHSAARFIYEVSKCRLFVGMKLHAVIFSICAGVAALGLEYSPKLRDFMSSLSSESELLSYENFSAEMLIERIGSASKNAESVAFRQWSAGRELAVRLGKYVEELNKIVHGWT